ncbi:sensor histidine kinase [Nocardioides sambongensis]|uniref:sensor histidine kinase n=1 Tax=Nocardioides sambongensis TaxID=2589074 RepID=UPI001128395B|nr:histidine kinase [Nocardioides sambongensis]
MVARGRLSERAAEFFAVDDQWVRPGGIGPQDLVVGAATFAFGVVSVELLRSVGTFEGVRGTWWVHWLVIATASALLVVRRRWPLTVLALAGAHMFLTGVLIPTLMGQVPLQMAYFFAIFSGVAWARSRRQMLAVVGVVMAFMALWLAWQFSLGRSLETLADELGLVDDRPGLLGPATAAVLLTALINVLYFGGAVLGGQVAWRSARQTTRLAAQAATIARQTAALQERAVLEERLRIARELHDVVAHHVSVIGVQAAAGRRMLGRDEQSVATALAQVEESSRDAVDEMRRLVGTLRAPAGDAPSAGAPRAPEPSWSEIGALAEPSLGDRLRVGYDLVESPPGAAGTLPAALGTSLYRIVQEAVTNVRRHSTATRAQIVLRVDRVATPPYAEVEVTDDGRPRNGTSGSGLGLLGVRERAAARRAVVDIGPRSVGGFRVRVRFPLADGSPAAAPAPAPAEAGAE